MGTVVTYPTTAAALASTTLSMTVNGSSVFVESINGVSYARFSFGGTADIVVTAAAAVTSR